MLGINSHALPVQGVQHNYGLLSVSVRAKRVAQTTRRMRRVTHTYIHIESTFLSGYIG